MALLIRKLVSILPAVIVREDETLHFSPASLKQTPWNTDAPTALDAASSPIPEPTRNSDDLMKDLDNAIEQMEVLESYWVKVKSLVRVFKESAKTLAVKHQIETEPTAYPTAVPAACEKDTKLGHWCDPGVGIYLGSRCGDYASTAMMGEIASANIPGIRWKQPVVSDCTKSIKPITSSVATPIKPQPAPKKKSAHARQNGKVHFSETRKDMGDTKSATVFPKLKVGVSAPVSTPSTTHTASSVKSTIAQKPRGQGDTKSKPADRTPETNPAKTTGEHSSTHNDLVVANETRTLAPSKNAKFDERTNDQITAARNTYSGANKSPASKQKNHSSSVGNKIKDEDREPSPTAATIAMQGPAEASIPLCSSTATAPVTKKPIRTIKRAAKTAKQGAEENSRTAKNKSTPTPEKRDLNNTAGQNTTRNTPSTPLSAAVVVAEAVPNVTTINVRNTENITDKSGLESCDDALAWLSAVYDLYVMRPLAFGQCSNPKNMASAVVSTDTVSQEDNFRGRAKPKRKTKGRHLGLVTSAAETDLADPSLTTSGNEKDSHDPGNVPAKEGFEFGEQFLMDEDFLVCQIVWAHFDKPGLEVANTKEGNYICGSDASSLANDERRQKGKQGNLAPNVHHNNTEHSTSADAVPKIGAPAPDDALEVVSNTSIGTEGQASDCKENAHAGTGKDEAQSVQTASSSLDTGLGEKAEEKAPVVGDKDKGKTPVEPEPLPDYIREYIRRVYNPKLSFEERWNMDPVPIKPNGEKDYWYVGCTPEEWKEQQARLREAKRRKAEAKKAKKEAEKPVEEKKEMNHEQWVAMCRRIFPELRHY
ncbi:hypothetical protein HK102_009054 [Quaeritorhiza haematococci]|nr:hypothetical protein HK102_009054 [Quaeritorhiza haematococci]